MSFPKSVLTLWTSVARQRGVECIIESGNASISYLIELTAYTDGLIRRPNRTWTIVSFSGNVKDLIVFVEKKDKVSKVRNVTVTWVYITMVKQSSTATLFGHFFAYAN